MDRQSNVEVTGLTQASGDTEISVNRLADLHQITIIPSAGATGTLQFDTKVAVNAPYENVKEGVGNMIVDLAENRKTFIIDGYFLTHLKVKPTAVVGSYTVLIQSARQ